VDNPDGLVTDGWAAEFDPGKHTAFAGPCAWQAGIDHVMLTTFQGGLAGLVVFVRSIVVGFFVVLRPRS